METKFKNCRSYHLAEIGSDHSLVLANLEISRSKRVRYAPRKIPKGYDIEKLRGPDVANRYEVEIGGRFSALLEERQPQELYDNFKRIIHSVAKQEIGLKQHKQLENLSREVINLCERRRKAKINLLNHPDDAEKQIEYRKLNKTVEKKSNLHKVDAKTHPSPLCPLCNIHTHDTHHLFNCTHIRTTLSPLDLWTDPAGVTALLAGGPQVGTSDSPH